MALKKSKVEQNEEVTTAEVTVEPKEETIPMSQVQALIDESIKNSATNGTSEELIKTLAEAISKGGKKDSKFEKWDEFAYLDPANIDKEDLLEEPVVFWAPGFGCIIADDRKNGIAIPPPYDIIKFQAEGSKKRQSGKDIHIQIWATYKSWSKKEVKFLEDHRLYGSRFFKKSNTTMDVDTRYTAKLANYAQALRRTPMNQIIDQARSLGIVISEDPDTMRLAIAQVRAKKEMEGVENASKVRAKENAKQNLVNGATQ